MVCAPSPKVVPGALGLVGMIAPSQTSVAVGAVQFTTAVHKPGSTGIAKLAGQPANTGAVWSRTLTLKEQFCVLP